MLGPLVRSVSNFEGHVQTISNSVVLSTSRTNVEQIVSALSAKMVAFETGASSAFSRDWPSLGQSGDSTATGSRDPIAMDENRNTRRRLDKDSSSDDDDDGLLFLLTPNVEVIWQSLFPKLSQPCCVISIKTMDRDTGKESKPYC